MNNPHRLAFRDLIGSPSAFIALGFGAGLSPVWPGTAGSLLGLALAWPLHTLHASMQIAFVSAGFAVGIWACERTGRALASHDHSAIVWDEIVSMAAVALFGPYGIAWWVASLLAFRLFDVLKPWPINLADQKLSNGFGVMLDDALAAIYAMGTIAALNHAVVALSR